MRLFRSALCNIFSHSFRNSTYVQTRTTQLRRVSLTPHPHAGRHTIVNPTSSSEERSPLRNRQSTALFHSVPYLTPSSVEAIPLPPHTGLEPAYKQNIVQGLTNHHPLSPRRPSEMTLPISSQSSTNTIFVNWKLSLKSAKNAEEKAMKQEIRALLSGLTARQSIIHSLEVVSAYTIDPSLPTSDKLEAQQISTLIHKNNHVLGEIYSTYNNFLLSPPGTAHAPRHISLGRGYYNLYFPHIEIQASRTARWRALLFPYLSLEYKTKQAYKKVTTTLHHIMQKEQEATVNQKAITKLYKKYNRYIKQKNKCDKKILKQCIQLIQRGHSIIHLHQGEEIPLMIKPEYLAPKAIQAK